MRCQRTTLYHLLGLPSNSARSLLPETHARASHVDHIVHVRHVGPSHHLASHARLHACLLVERKHIPLPRGSRPASHLVSPLLAYIVGKDRAKVLIWHLEQLLFRMMVNVCWHHGQARLARERSVRLYESGGCSGSLLCLTQQSRNLLILSLTGLRRHLGNMSLRRSLLWRCGSLLARWIHWSREQWHGWALLRTWWQVEAADLSLEQLILVSCLQRSLLSSLLLLELCPCLCLGLLLCLCLCHLDLGRIGLTLLEALLICGLRSLSLRYGCVLLLTSLSTSTYLSAVVVAGCSDFSTGILQPHG